VQIVFTCWRSVYAKECEINANYRIATACEQSNIPEPELGPDVLVQLMFQKWPCNARSLMNATMRFGLDLSDAIGDSKEDLGLPDQMARVEKSLLNAAHQNRGGNANEPAQTLKLPENPFMRN
jgi:two-component system C4-dicarboxylate transport response regulator DctD